MQLNYMELFIIIKCYIYSYNSLNQLNLPNMGQIFHIISNGMDIEEMKIHFLGVKKCGLHIINPIDMVHIT